MLRNTAFLWYLIYTVTVKNPSRNANSFAQIYTIK